MEGKVKDVVRNGGVDLPSYVYSAPATNLDGLDDDSLSYVYQFLTVDERRKLREVCTRLCDFAETSYAWDAVHVILGCWLSTKECFNKIRGVKKIRSLQMGGSRRLQLLNFVLRNHSKSIRSIHLIMTNEQTIFRSLQFVELKNLILRFPVIRQHLDWSLLPYSLPHLEMLELFGYIPSSFAHLVKCCRGTLKDIIYHSTSVLLNSFMKEAMNTAPYVTFTIIHNGSVSRSKAKEEFGELCTLFPETNILYFNKFL